jgi:hypothetical protein
VDESLVGASCSRDCESLSARSRLSPLQGIKIQETGHSQGHSAVRCRARLIEAAAARRSQTGCAVSRGPRPLSHRAGCRSPITSCVAPNDSISAASASRPERIVARAGALECAVAEIERPSLDVHGDEEPTVLRRCNGIDGRKGTAGGGNRLRGPVGGPGRDAAAVDVLNGDVRGARNRIPTAARQEQSRWSGSHGTQAARQIGTAHSRRIPGGAAPRGPVPAQRLRAVSPARTPIA